MRILFTPAGDTDPVRGYRDGAILHILRHYEVDKVILFLTKEMEEKEEKMGCYTKGIHSVSPKVPITAIKSSITNQELVMDSWLVYAGADYSYQEQHYQSL